MALKENYKDDILDVSVNTKRKYRVTENQDGTISLDDETVYTQEGDSFGASDINAITHAVNNIATDAENTSYDNTESGLISDNVQGAIDEINADLTDGIGGTSDTFRFGTDGNGNYGYIKKVAGADTFFPFKTTNHNHYTQETWSRNPTDDGNYKGHIDIPSIFDISDYDIGKKIFIDIYLTINAQANVGANLSYSKLNSSTIRISTSNRNVTNTIAARVHYFDDVKTVTSQDIPSFTFNDGGNYTGYYDITPSVDITNKTPYEDIFVQISQTSTVQATVGGALTLQKINNNKLRLYTSNRNNMRTMKATIYYLDF